MAPIYANPLRTVSPGDRQTRGRELLGDEALHLEGQAGDGHDHRLLLARENGLNGQYKHTRPAQLVGEHHSAARAVRMAMLKDRPAGPAYMAGPRVESCLHRGRPAGPGRLSGLTRPSQTEVAGPVQYQRLGQLQGWSGAARDAPGGEKKQRRLARPQRLRRPQGPPTPAPGAIPPRRQTPAQRPLRQRWKAPRRPPERRHQGCCRCPFCARRVPEPPGAGGRARGAGAAGIRGPDRAQGAGAAGSRGPDRAHPQTQRGPAPRGTRDTSARGGAARAHFPRARAERGAGGARRSGAERGGARGERGPLSGLSVPVVAVSCCPAPTQTLLFPIFSSGTVAYRVESGQGGCINKQPLWARPGAVLRCAVLSQASLRCVSETRLFWSGMNGLSRD